MPANVATALQSPKVSKLDEVRPRGFAGQAKADVDGAFVHGEAIWNLLTKEHESVKDMAYQMDQTERSLLRRQILEGNITLKKLLKADPKALAAFGEFLVDTYGESKKSKREIAREKLPELLTLFIDAMAEDK